MIFNDTGHLVGRYTVQGYDENWNPAEFECNGQMVSTYRGKNVLTQLLFTGFFKFLNAVTDTPAYDDLNITHLAVGTGTTAPAKTDTTLENEYFRKAVSSKSYTDDIFTAKMLMGTTEGNTTITEIGVFADATDTTDSGTLLSHIAVNITKTDSISLLLTWTLTLE
jgi:hypothetical protein